MHLLQVPFEHLHPQPVLHAYQVIVAHSLAVDRMDEALMPRRGAMSGGLTRYARGAGEMIVNSSRGGGCKDTWVLGSAPGGRR